MGEELVFYFVGDFEALQGSGSVDNAIQCGNLVSNIRKIVYLGCLVNRAE